MSQWSGSRYLLGEIETNMEIDFDKAKPICREKTLAMRTKNAVQVFRTWNCTIKQVTYFSTWDGQSSWYYQTTECNDTLNLHSDIALRSRIINLKDSQILITIYTSQMAKIRTKCYKIEVGTLPLWDLEKSMETVKSSPQNPKPEIHRSKQQRIVKIYGGKQVDHL